MVEKNEEKVIFNDTRQLIIIKSVPLNKIQ